jgi:hypothetical protein
MAQYLDEEAANNFLKQINSMCKGAELMEQGYVRAGHIRDCFRHLLQDVGDSKWEYIRPSDRMNTKEARVLFIEAAANDEEKAIYKKLKGGDKLVTKDMDYLLSLFSQFAMPLINPAFAQGYSAKFSSLLKANERNEEETKWLVDKVENSLSFKYKRGMHQEAYAKGGFTPNNPYVKMAADFDANAKSIAERQAAAKEKYQDSISSLTSELKTSNNSLSSLLQQIK